MNKLIILMGPLKMSLKYDRFIVIYKFVKCKSKMSKLFSLFGETWSSKPLCSMTSGLYIHIYLTPKLDISNISIG